MGQSGLPAELNAWLYRIGRRNVLAFLQRTGVLGRGLTDVFEVGAGTGYWTSLWWELGARQVDGCDLIEAAVQRLRATFPRSAFFAGDIARPGVIPEGQTYGLVTVMNVLLHVPDEGDFDVAARNIASAVRPGGHLFLAEAALARPWHGPPVDPHASSKARTIGRYRSAFEGNGLRLVALGPSAVVAANPIDVPGRIRLRLAMASWSLVTRLGSSGPRSANMVGRVLELTDRLLMRTGWAPAGKLMLFERAEARTPSGGPRSPQE